MENREKVIELFLALIFISILLLAVVFVLTESNDSNQRTVNTISNSYNTNSYNSYVQKPIIKEPKKIEPIYLKQTVLKKTYFEKKDYLDYSSYGKHTQRKDFVGSYVDEFNVYVVNKDFRSGYFEVKFYFEDYSGKKFVESIDHYVMAGEKEEFKFFDVQFEKYKYSDWWYKVIPGTKTFDRKDYVIKSYNFEKEHYKYIY